MRRQAPYELKLVQRELGNGTAFGGDNWTAEDAAVPGTDRETSADSHQQGRRGCPQRRFANTWSPKLTENEVKARQKIHSNAFHLLCTNRAVARRWNDVAGCPPRPQEQRSEIDRVAMTLLGLMQVSR